MGSIHAESSAVFIIQLSEKLRNWNEDVPNAEMKRLCQCMKCRGVAILITTLWFCARLKQQLKTVLSTVYWKGKPRTQPMSYKMYIAPHCKVKDGWQVVHRPTPTICLCLGTFSYQFQVCINTRANCIDDTLLIIIIYVSNSLFCC